MYDNSPKVSIICLCHNQAKYVQDALRSVVAQTYRPIELIVADDGSTDDSIVKIREILPHIPPEIVVKPLFLSQNVGNCAVFNRAWQMATGDFIIDLAADDLLLPTHVAVQIATFQHAPPDVGVVFSDVWLADETAQPKRSFYKRDAQGRLTEQVPSGDIYADLLHRYCVCTPAMMIRNQVLQQLGGYDENLSYEDYDFWVRSSRDWKYLFIDSITVIKREISGSHGKKMYQKGFSRHRYSTLQVCKKAAALNRKKSEDAALARMVRYQMRLCLYQRDFINLQGFYELLQRIAKVGITDRLLALPLLFTGRLGFSVVKC
jgi:glycosyltransferase involved in cell wall biosynthesis